MCDLDIMEKNQRLGSQMLARIIANPDTCGHACLVVQSCPTLCNPLDYTQPGSSVHGIFQARKLKFPSPEDLPEPGTEPESPALVGGFFTNEPPGKSN